VVVRGREAAGVGSAGAGDVDDAVLRRLLFHGARVALGDGAGVPAGAARSLSAAARAAGDVELVVGWLPGPLPPLELDAFATVRALMGGYGLRRPIDSGAVRYVPVRLGAVPALLRSALRVDLLVASVRRREDGWAFTTEVSWQRAAVDAGALVAGIERRASPCADGGPPLPDDRVVLAGTSPSPPATVEWAWPSGADRVIAERVAALVPEGVRLQVAPGPVGDAVLDALGRPVRLDTGVLTDAAVGVARRGLLVGDPLATYVAGGRELYDWVAGRRVVRGVEVTHDAARLSGGPPFVAVNTALEIDLDGQVNVEAVGGSVVAGVGGQPDYAYGAASSTEGLSVVALPTMRGVHHPTLVERLAAPASTPGHDVDVVVTELGVADLRGLDRGERRRAIARLWGAGGAGA
jgi:hypothetical protein